MSIKSFKSFIENKHFSDGRQQITSMGMFVNPGFNNEVCDRWVDLGLSCGKKKAFRSAILPAL